MGFLITLTSDFGQADGFVGVMKAVIAGIAPNARLVDISHELRPCDIKAGAWVIGNAYRYFPDDTIHMAIVDPGVGSSRRSLLIETEHQYFVGPDNGLFSYVIRAEDKVTCYELNRSEFWLPVISTSFHGRDIFAPVAAHLASGKRPDELGGRIDPNSLVLLPEALVQESNGTLKGSIVYIDRFGNLITNIPIEIAKNAHACKFDQTVIPIGTTYSSVPDGGAVAYGGSHGFVEIAVSHGNAAEFLRADVDDEVVVELKA